MSHVYMHCKYIAHCIIKQIVVTIIIHDFIFMTGARFSKISQALKFRTNIPHLKINMQVSVLFTGNKNRF